MTKSDFQVVAGILNLQPRLVDFRGVQIATRLPERPRERRERTGNRVRPQPLGLDSPYCGASSG
ncbi:hypothetical protein OG216_46705 (plasmid) [Streptomycetaceae bacterium NBC_01309]